jgi:hypothetical protein
MDAVAINNRWIITIPLLFKRNKNLMIKKRRKSRENVPRFSRRGKARLGIFRKLEPNKVLRPQS